MNSDFEKIPPSPLDKNNRTDAVEIENTLKHIYEALCEKGYDPARQIAGYILSEDPVYITNWKNARGLIGHINRDDLLIFLINHYLNEIKR